MLNEKGASMEKKIAKEFSKRLKNDIKYSNIFSLNETINDNALNGFHNFADDKPCIGAFLLTDNFKKLWVLVIDWHRDDNYYIVIYPEDNNLAPLSEIHKIDRHNDGLDIKWSYAPSKRDKKNKMRKQYFESMFGSIEAIISLPSHQVGIDDFLTDIFHLTDCRVKADNLDKSEPLISSATFPEGKRLERKHKLKERSPALVAQAKFQHFKNNNGSLPCEVCGFDFFKVYGKRGSSFIEAHHILPLSLLDDDKSSQIKISDLVLLCANCHRMLHRRPWTTIKKLKSSMASA